MNAILWLAVLAAGMTSLLAPLVFRSVLHRWGAFDMPNHRSSHSKPTLRGGGVAPLAGVAVGGMAAVLVLSGRSVLFVLIIVCAGAIASGVGLAEDIRGLRVVIRAGSQMALGGTVAVVLTLASGSSWLWVPVAALFFAAHVNFTNFMDGINGISGLHGLSAGLIYAAVGLVSDLTSLVFTGLIAAVSFAAFLPWNFAPPGMFLGDVGSYLLGGMLGTMALVALYAGVNPVASLAPLGIYWADTVSTLVRRVVRGEPIFQAHRSHAYQRLTNTGLSHAAVACIVACCTFVSGGIGLLTATSWLGWRLGALFVAVFLACYLLLPRLRGDVLLAPQSIDLGSVMLPEPVEARRDWSPAKWAVIGGSGFIGRSTVDHLVSEGMNVVALPAPRLELDPDVADGAIVAKIAMDHPAASEVARALVDIDVVVNAAGMASPDARADTRLYGANALLPAVIAVAALEAGVGRILHLSSAAVQGDRAMLDASPEVSPFSPYSRSKALGERALFAAAHATRGDADTVVVRATSVQGRGRPTTEALRRVARSRLASVASPGDYPSVVSSVHGLVRFVHRVGTSTDALPPIVLQPWEGLNVTQVLGLAGGRRPLMLPGWLCRTVITMGKCIGRLIPRLAGTVRRVEVMWFGQRQEISGLDVADAKENQRLIRQVFEGQ